MRPTLTSIVAILGFCAISNLALGQSVEPQLEAPEPDITTFDAGERYTTTFDTKNDIDIRILDGGNLINGVGHTLYNNGTLDNNVGGQLWNHSSTLNNSGTLNNFGEMFQLGTLNNSGTLNHFGEMFQLGTLNNSGTLNIFGELRNVGTINGRVDVKAGGILTGDYTINGSVLLGGTIAPNPWRANIETSKPGAMVTGTITTGNQTWLNGASYGWAVSGSDGIAGDGIAGNGFYGWDLVNITETSSESGTLDLSNLTTGGFGIDIISLDIALYDLGLAEGFDDPNGEYEFVILTAVGGITGFDAENFVINDDGFQNSGTWDWSIEQDGNNLVLSATGYTLVPEPSSTALLALGGLAVTLRRKRS